MSSRPTRSRFGIRGLALPIALVTVAIIAAVLTHRPAQSGADALEVYGQLPAIDTVDQTGAAITGDELRGKTLIVGFLFTRCTTICPVIALKMQRLAERTENAGPSITLVAISVDPEHDRPPVLAEFAARYDADPERWKFLTGDPAAIREAVEGGMKINMERRGTLEDGSPDIAHGSHFILVDRDLQIRGYYDSGDAKRLDALVRDARALSRSDER